MPTIIVTDEAARAIRSAAIRPFRETGTRLPDGTWEIPVDQEVLDAMDAARMSGETVSDVIIRLAALDRSGGRSH